MAKYKSCSKCPRVFEKPHKYVSLCPKCRADLYGKRGSRQTIVRPRSAYKDNVMNKVVETYEKEGKEIKVVKRTNNESVI